MSLNFEKLRQSWRSDIEAETLSGILEDNANCKSSQSSASALLSPPLFQLLGNKLVQLRGFVLQQIKVILM